MTDPAGLGDREVGVGGEYLSLPDFLVRCASALRAGTTDSALAARCEAFVGAGLDALDDGDARQWVQIGLETAAGPGPELYRALAAAARELSAGPAVSGFFFMHKPPGLRIRFAVAAEAAADFASGIRQAAGEWQAAGLITGVVPGVYEPETRLFGGPAAMACVHDLFERDSIAWLRYHSTVEPDPGPAWALSLVMLRHLFTGIGIVDWEDVDVWDRVTRRTGRSMPGEALATDDFRETASGIVSLWNDADALVAELSEPARAIVAAYAASAAPVIERWRRDYFQGGDALLGPRQAAALYTIFHWNRSGMSIARQSVISESLAARETI